MRKQVNGLSLIAGEQMAQDPLSGNLFLFCNRERRILKALYWDIMSMPLMWVSRSFWRGYHRVHGNARIDEGWLSVLGYLADEVRPILGLVGLHRTISWATPTGVTLE
jgi:hypothetical protein